MSPGRPSRAAELGANPHHLAATIFKSLDAATEKNASTALLAVEAAAAQAAAIALLAVHVGRLADAMEADVANVTRAAALPLPVPPEASR